MSAILRATAVSSSQDLNALDNMVAAGLRCIERAGIAMADVDLLINVGIYRENNVMEPSIAALIQQKMELNPDPAKQSMQQRTMSYDLLNGSCGFLNAVTVASAALKTGSARNALIVSGDVHPSATTGPHFPFATMGAACLLAWSDAADTGFGPVHVRSSERGGFHGFMTLGVLNEFGTTGRAQAKLVFQDGYAEKCRHFAATVARDFLAAENIAPDQVDVLVTSQIEQNFPHRLAADIGIAQQAYRVDLYERLGDPHSAALPVCLNYLQDENLLQPGKQILLVAVGAGLTAACALYRV